jgi:hypothetical protein
MIRLALYRLYFSSIRLSYEFSCYDKALGIALGDGLSCVGSRNLHCMGYFVSGLGLRPR